MPKLGQMTDDNVNSSAGRGAGVGGVLRCARFENLVHFPVLIPGLSRPEISHMNPCTSSHINRQVCEVYQVVIIHSSLCL